MFNEQCITAFKKLKSSLTFPMLQLHDPRRETELHTDASSVALTAILLQKQNSDLWAAIIAKQ